MSQINRIPLGYLNMLQAQTGGKTPFETFDQVMPTIDMDEFYLAQGLSVEFINFTPAGNGDSVALVVPQNETWFVRYMTGSMTSIAAADQTQYIMGIRQLPKSGLTAITLAVSPVLTAVAITQSLTFSHALTAPFWMQSGSEFFLQVQNLVNPRNTFLTVLVQKFSA